MGDELDKMIEVGILFDFYGKLLTDKQYLAIKLYYMEDLSLSEIGEEIEVTRQGVFDLLKRAEAKLYSFEEELGLVSKFFVMNDKTKEILKLSKLIQEKNIEDEIREELLEIDRLCIDIINKSQEVE